MTMTKYLNPVKYWRYIFKRVKKASLRKQGDFFGNPGPIFENDFEELRKGIVEIRPKVYVEIGTATGISASRTFIYLKEHNPECEFYTLDIFEKYSRSIAHRFSNEPRFHALTGLSVRINETDDPARKELKNYRGPTDVLRKLFSEALAGKKLDIAFIDSRVGTALPELLVLEEYLADNGIIFCHDILNRGKGVEVLFHLELNRDRYEFEVVNTGPAGIIKIRLKN
jgi:predicted O-methyltransferase YrrM